MALVQGLEPVFGPASVPMLGAAALVGAVGGFILGLFSTGEINRTGSPDVRINGLAAARAIIDYTKCHGMFWLEHFSNSRQIAVGVQHITVNGYPLARVGSKSVCGAKICEGSEDVFTGGPTYQYLPIETTRSDDILRDLSEKVSRAIAIATLGSMLLDLVSAGSLLGGLALLKSVNEIFFYDLDDMAADVTRELNVKFPGDSLQGEIDIFLNLDSNEKLSKARIDSIESDYYGCQQHQQYGAMVEHLSSGRISKEQAMAMNPFGGDVGPGWGVTLADGTVQNHALRHDAGGFLKREFHVGPGYGGFDPANPFSGQFDGITREVISGQPLSPLIRSPFRTPVLE